MRWDINTPPEELEVRYANEWYSVVALYPRTEGILVIYEQDGSHWAVVRFPEKAADMRRKRKKYKGWVNVFSWNGLLSFGRQHESLADARSEGGLSSLPIIACIEVEFEEGDGL